MTTMANLMLRKYGPTVAATTEALVEVQRLAVDLPSEDARDALFHAVTAIAVAIRDEIRKRDEAAAGATSTAIAAFAQIAHEVGEPTILAGLDHLIACIDRERATPAPSPSGPHRAAQGGRPE